MRNRLLAGIGASACVVGAALVAPATASAATATSAAVPATSAALTSSYQASLSPIAANKVTGTGASWISVTGSTAEVKIQVNGLLDGVPHAQHLRIDAQGTCPTQPALHNGLPTISVADGTPFYGNIGTSLTAVGDTSPAAALALPTFPSTGSYTYSRTIELDPTVVANLQRGTAVLVVHGIDYNSNGAYDDVLGRSELDPTLSAEATDVALCGAFVPMQMAGVPDGAADTGGGSTAAVAHRSAAQQTGAEQQTGIAVTAAVLVSVGAGAVARVWRAVQG